MSEALVRYQELRAQCEEAEEAEDWGEVFHLRGLMERVWKKIPFEEQCEVDTMPGCPDPFEGAT